MLTIILTTLFIFLVLAIFVAMLELSGGFLGDSSMVPGILITMIITLLIIIGIGLLTGNIQILIGGL